MLNLNNKYEYQYSSNMPKKHVAKPQETESKGEIEFVEEKRTRLDIQTQDDMKKYVGFLVREELTPMKDELLALIQEGKILTQNLKHSLLEFNNLQLTIEQSHLFKFKEEDVLSLYEKGNISLGRAAELCNLKYDKMIDKLLEKRIKLKFGPENIDEALEEERAFRTKMQRS